MGLFMQIDQRESDKLLQWHIFASILNKMYNEVRLQKSSKS